MDTVVRLADILLVVQYQSAAHERLPVPELPEEKGIGDEIAVEENNIGERIIKIFHQRLSKFTPDVRIGDGGAEIGLVAVEHQLRAAFEFSQRDGLERLRAVRQAAGIEELFEFAPVDVYGLLEALDTAMAMPGQPGEVERNPVVLFVEPEFSERVDVGRDDTAFLPETVKLLVGDVEVLGWFQTRGVK